MAQKVTGFIKLQIPAGKATPAPPVGPALGQHGVNIMAFTKEFNERTKNDVGLVIPVVITVYADRSFTFITKTPPAAVLLKKACGLAVSYTHLTVARRDPFFFQRAQDAANPRIGVLDIVNRILGVLLHLSLIHICTQQRSRLGLRPRRRKPFGSW